ncbi:MAG: retron St85 family effector protein [Bordetella sp.]|uniref:retron St85 family effector protein n=1 Tax=Bordetella sp. TaxID=28081 RepID=UPI003F7BCF4D
MHSTIKTVADSIDLTKTRVRRAGRRITVFGGALQNPDQPPSQRNAFITTLHLVHSRYTKRIITPENYKDWNHFGVYHDLLSFEEDLCALVDVIVIFLETEGAIAEFASFIKVPIALPKLVIGVTEGYEEDDSFINLGLVRYLRAQPKHRDTDPDPVFVVPPQIDVDDATFIWEEVDRRLGLLSETEAFDPRNLSHQMLLVADFIELMQVARQNDINIFLEQLGINIAAHRLTQFLFVLQRLEIIELLSASNDRFFRFCAGDNYFIDYAQKEAATPRERLKVRLYEKMQSEPRRKHAYKKMTKMGGADNGA